MDELFLPDETTDTSVDNMTTLPADMAQWPEFIIEKVHAQFGVPDGVATRYNIKTADEEQRSAIGGLILSPTQMPERQIVFPIIIERGMLYPLDIFFIDGEYRPATREALEGLFNEMFQYTPSVANPMDDQNASQISSSNTLNVPLTYKAASSLLETLDLTPEQLEKVSHITSKYPGYFQKLASEPILVHDELGLPHTHLEDVNSADVVQIRTTDYADKYDVLWTNGHLLPPKTRLVSGPVVRGILASFVEGPYALKSYIETLEKDGYITLYNSPEVGAALTSEQERLSPAVLDGYGKVLTADGMIHKGFCFPALIDIHGKPMPGLTLFVSNQGKYSLGNTLYTKHESTISMEAIRGQLPTAGSKGVFLFENADGVVECTCPVSIKYLVNVDGNVSVGAELMLGGDTTFKFDRLVRRLVTITSSNGGSTTTLLPIDAKFLPFKHPVCLVESPLPLTAQGEDMLGLMKVALHKDSVGTTIEFQGKQIAHMAKQAEAELVLGTLGASQHMVKRAFDLLEKNGSSMLEGRFMVKSAMDQMVKLAGNKGNSKFRLNRGPLVNVDMIRLAAEVEGNPESVDILLGLGFFSPEQLSKFTQQLPTFKKAMSQLAKLVLFARVTKSMDHNVLRDALFGLDQVTTQLEGMAE